MRLANLLCRMLIAIVVLQDSVIILRCLPPSHLPPPHLHTTSLPYPNYPVSALLSSSFPPPLLPPLPKLPSKSPFNPFPFPPPCNFNPSLPLNNDPLSQLNSTLITRARSALMPGIVALTSVCELSGVNVSIKAN